MRWDHPRVRGEHVTPDVLITPVMGSSPRARGARRMTRVRRRSAGIIPACAGSTAPRADRVLMSWDYPRVRGEHTVGHDPQTDQEGSSPRARGAPGHTQHRVRVGGIIPACAGSTCRSAGRAAPHRDHPRVRGEHNVDLHTIASERGSSPRARGARPSGSLLMLSEGIIPACAGSTWGMRDLGTHLGDHPRVRGEHQQGSPPTLPLRGSSPRARGALIPRPPSAIASGIIPACAGSTGRYLKTQ